MKHIAVRIILALLVFAPIVGCQKLHHYPPKVEVDNIGRGYCVRVYPEVDSGLSYQESFLLSCNTSLNSIVALRDATARSIGAP